MLTPPDWNKKLYLWTCLKAGPQLFVPAASWHVQHFPIAPRGRPLSSVEVKATGRTEEDAACARSASLPLGSHHTGTVRAAPRLGSHTRLPLAARTSVLYSLHRFKVLVASGQTQLNPVRVRPWVLGLSFCVGFRGVNIWAAFCCTAVWSALKRRQKGNSTYFLNKHLKRACVWFLKRSLLRGARQNFAVGIAVLSSPETSLIWN